MGQGQSKKESSLAEKAQREAFLEQYNKAAKKVEKDIPRLKLVYDNIMKAKGSSNQAVVFYKYLYQWYIYYTGDQIPYQKADQLKLLAQGLFFGYSSEKIPMKFENFVCLYNAIVSHDNNDKFELAWRVYSTFSPKVDEESKEEYIMAGRFQKVGLARFGISQDHAKDFFSNFLNIQEDREILKSEFHEFFDKFRHDPYFAWVDGFIFEIKGLQNAQETPTDIIDTPLNAELSLGGSQDFTPEEKKALENFFQTKIAVKTDINQASKELQYLMDDRSISKKLRNRLVESFLYASDSDLYYDKNVFMKIMRVIFKERDELVIKNFIFDIFTKYSKEEIMNRKQIEEVFQVFGQQSQAKQGKPESASGNGLLFDSASSETPGREYGEEDIKEHIKTIQTLERSTFMELYSEYLDHSYQFQKLRTILFVEMRVRPETGRAERQIIESILENNLNLQDFILQNMRKNDKFFIVNKRFWDKWLDYTRSEKTKRDKEGIFKIDNESLFLQKTRSLVLQPLKLNENIVVMPPRIWEALVAWYGSTEEIRRTVIEYPKTKDAAMNSNNLRKLSPDGNAYIELEIDLMQIKVGKLQDNGDFPSQIASLTTISPKMTLQDVHEKVRKIFKIKRDSQLFMRDTLLTDEALMTVVEQNKEIKEGIRFFIEEQLENGNWPSDARNLKKLSRNPLIDFRTVGCWNLGNTCYINSVNQCVTNTHFFHQYFLQSMFNTEGFNPIPGGDPDWKFIKTKRADLVFNNQINVNNPMGFEGKIIQPFARLIEDLYVSKLACVKEPKRFKSAMGQFHEQFQGNQQQDAQEFLVILLDSMHEELNIRQKKPYIEKPDSAGRDPDELAMETWSNFLHRNWSFIVFLFYGQLRSFLKCVECETERISFDEFSTLSLPLPESSLINFKIIIQLLPFEIKSILVNKELIQQRFKNQLESQRRKATLNFDVQDMNIQLITKERPIVISISMNPSANLREVTEHLCKAFSNLNLIPYPSKTSTVEDQLTELVYYLQYDFQHRIELIIPLDTQLNRIREGTSIYAAELLTKRGKSLISDFYSGNALEFQAHSRNVLLNFNPVQVKQNNGEAELPEELKEQDDFFECIESADEKKEDKEEHQSQAASDEQDQSKMEVLVIIENEENQKETVVTKEDIKEQTPLLEKDEPLEELKEEEIVEKVDGGDKKEFSASETEQELDGIPMGKVTINELFNVEPPKPIDESVFQIDTSSKPKQGDFFEQKRPPPGRRALEVQTINIDTNYQQYSLFQFQQPRSSKQDFSNFHRNQVARNARGYTEDSSQIIYRHPKQFLVYFVNRKICLRDIYLTFPSRFKMEMFGTPLFVMANEQTTGRHLYEEVWMRCRFMLNLTSSKYYEDPMNLWWNRFQNEEDRVFAIRENTKFLPFVLKFIRNQNEEAQQCSSCNGNQVCYGCILDADNHIPIGEILKDQSFLAIDWNFEFLKQYFNPQFLQHVEHVSLKDSDAESIAKEATLVDCLKMFESIEEIPVREGINCEKCKVPTHHQRKISVSKAPPILIIHLKRFKIINNTRRKIDQYINFPLYDLDMSPFLSSQGGQGSQIYDLYGIINHYGSINGGHYISFIKNERTNQWWEYDDSTVKQLGESQVRSKFAYILFYKRRDIMTKSLDQIYPSIGFSADLFRGKPVRLRQEDGTRKYGYLWQVVREDGGAVDKFEVRLDKGGVVLATLEMIDQDDKDDISELQNSEAYLRKKEDEKRQREVEEKEQKAKEKLKKKTGSAEKEKEEKKETENADEKEKTEDDKKKDKKDKKKNKDCSIY